jgi:hypothetical protein
MTRLELLNKMRGIKLKTELPKEEVKKEVKLPKEEVKKEDTEKKSSSKKYKSSGSDVKEEDKSE